MEKKVRPKLRKSHIVCLIYVLTGNCSMIGVQFFFESDYTKSKMTLHNFFLFLAYCSMRGNYRFFLVKKIAFTEQAKNTYNNLLRTYYYYVMKSIKKCIITAAAALTFYNVINRKYMVYNIQGRNHVHLTIRLGLVTQHLWLGDFGKCNRGTPGSDRVLSQISIPKKL